MVFRKNRPAIHVVIPIWRAFTTILCGPRSRSNLRCTAFGINGISFPLRSLTLSRSRVKRVERQAPSRPIGFSSMSDPNRSKSSSSYLAFFISRHHPPASRSLVPPTSCSGMGGTGLQQKRRRALYLGGPRRAIAEGRVAILREGPSDDGARSRWRSRRALIERRLEGATCIPKCPVPASHCISRGAGQSSVGGGIAGCHCRCHPTYWSIVIGSHEACPARADLHLKAIRPSGKVSNQPVMICVGLKAPRVHICDGTGTSKCCDRATCTAAN